MKFKILLLQLMAMLMLTINIEAKANSPTSTNGFSVEFSHDYSCTDNANLQSEVMINPVESFAVPLYVLQINYNEYYANKSDLLNSLNMLDFPLLNYKSNLQGNTINININKTHTVSPLDYEEFGYSIKS